MAEPYRTSGLIPSSGPVGRRKSLARQPAWSLALWLVIVSLLAPRPSLSYHAPAGRAKSPDMAPVAWSIQCVDCPKVFDEISNRSLRLDATGRPAIAYGGDHLYYAVHDGAGWRRETVDAAAGVGAYAALADRKSVV